MKNIRRKHNTNVFTFMLRQMNAFENVTINNTLVYKCRAYFWRYTCFKIVISNMVEINEKKKYSKNSRRMSRF